MTILKKNQPWPQIEVSEFNRSIGLFGGYKYKIVDKSIGGLVSESISRFAYKRGNIPTALFAGPRARNKIEELISKDNDLVVGDPTCVKNEFFGLELVSTIDDGLWMA